MRRQNFFDQIGPLDQADALSVEVVLVTDLIHLLDITDPIYVKMVKRKPAAIIDLHNGKGRTVYRFRNSKSLCQSLGEYGLANSQVTHQ